MRFKITETYIIEIDPTKCYELPKTANSHEVKKCLEDEIKYNSQDAIKAFRNISIKSDTAVEIL